MLSPAHHTILQAGALFLYKGRQYRLDGFLCEMPERQRGAGVVESLLAQIEAELQISGQRRIRLRWCLPEHASYVSGSGVCGCVAPISEIEFAGIVAWSEQDLAAHHEAAVRRGRKGDYAESIVRPI